MAVDAMQTEELSEAAMAHSGKVEQDVDLGREELAALLAINRAIARHLHRDQLFGALATCLRDVVPTERFGIELPIEGERLQGHLLTPRAGREEPTQPTVLPARGTACDWVLRNRRWLVTGSREELRDSFPITFDIMQAESMESLCALPLVIGETCRGVLFFMAAARDAYAVLRRRLLEEIGSAVAVALDDCLAHEEVRRLRDQLAAENDYLQEEIKGDFNFGEIIGGSPVLRRVLGLIERVAPTDATVLILGETGTGKELIARAIHERSARRARALVKVNCAAISAGLVESELFGHVRGAFTGAVANRSGRFALADGGTIFLDEIGELPLETQVKLLRVLQEREFEPVGSSATQRVDVRVIAATNRDLQSLVADGRFRSDLYYRLNVLPIRVPPLRDRREDVPLLVKFLAERSARKIARPIASVSRSTLELLAAYHWPGNIRELQNVIERAVVLSSGSTLEIGPELLGISAPVRAAAAPRIAPSGASASAGPVAARASSAAPVRPPGAARGVSADAKQAAHGAVGSSHLEEIARQHMLRVLDRCGWVIEGPAGAARILSLNPSTLRSRMKKLGLSPPQSLTDR